MKLIAVTFCLLLSFSLAVAQTLTPKVTNKPLKEKIFTASDIVGELNGNLLVANLSPGDFSPEGLNVEHLRLQLALYNKSNYNLIKAVPLKWVGQKVRSNLNWSVCKNVFILNNQVYVVWQSYSNKRYSLLVQILDANLKEVKPPATVYEFPTEMFIHNQASLFGLTGPGKKTLILGGEESAEKKENVKLQYKVFDEKMKVLQTVQVQLPFYKKKRNSGAAATYLPDDNGDLYYVTTIVNKNKDKAFMIGKIQADNSTTAEIYIPSDRVRIIDINMVHSGNLLKGFAITTKGLATFTIDKGSFSLTGDLLENELDYNKVKFTDFNSVFSKANIEEHTIKRIMNETLTISNVRELPDGRYILTLNNMMYYEVCSRNGCTPYTRVDGQHYAMITSDGALEWLSCTKQKFNKRTFYRSDDDVAIVGNTLLASTFGGMNIQCVDLVSGKITIKPVKKNFKYRIMDIENDHIYTTDYKARKSLTTIAVTAGILGGSIAAAILTKQYVFLAGAVVGTAVIGFSRTQSDVYLGEILIHK